MFRVKRFCWLPQTLQYLKDTLQGLLKDLGLHLRAQEHPHVEGGM